MLKTIKVKKQLRLDELIKYVWDNRLSNVFYDSTSRDLTVSFDTFGRIYGANGSLSHIEMHHEFSVELEEEITKRTPFEWLIEVNKSGIHEEETSSISAIEDEDTIRIYALIDKKLELIWEAE